eukprot:jgi/Mesvir1/138/Mv03473-RA.1
MERALRLVDFYTRHLSACDEIVLERVSVDEDEVAEYCVGKNVVIAGQIIRKQKFPEGDWKDVLEVCVEAADEAIEKIALKSSVFPEQVAGRILLLASSIKRVGSAFEQDECDEPTRVVERHGDRLVIRG